MTVRVLIFRLLMFSTVVGNAATDQDTIPMATVDHRVNDVEAHVRSGARRWQLIWDQVDDANYRVIDVRCSPSDNHDFNMARVKMSMARVIDGARHPGASKQFDTPSEGVSVMIRRRPDTLSILVGNGLKWENAVDKKSLADTPTRYRLIHPSEHKPEVCYVSVTPIKALTMRYLPADSIQDVLSASSDSITGLWRYLDSDFDASKVLMPVRYNIILVKDLGDDYKILDARTVTGDDGRRRHLVKGYLEKTPFVGNYNLRWFDADGNDIGEAYEGYATSQGNILKLSFPAIEASLRVYKP